MPTGAGCWRSSPPQAAQAPQLPLRPLQPLTEAFEQPGEGRVLLHLDVQVTHAGVVDGLAVAVVDRQLTGTENLQRLLERLRSATVARADLAAAARASARGSRAGAQRACGAGLAGRQRRGPRRDG